MAKALGAILGVPLALFAIGSSIVDQPLIALAVALITAILASIWVAYTRWTGLLEVVVAWMALVVVVLAGLVIWPRTMTIEGTIRDTAGNPVSNEMVVLFDRSGRRYETKTNAEGHYQFTDVPTGKYRVQVGGTEIEGGTTGFLVRVVQQNIAVAPSPIVTPTNTPTPTSMSTATPTNTPTPTPTPSPVGTIGKSGVYCTDSGSGGTETLAVDPPRTVAQIRIDMQKRATGYGDSLWEVEAYGPDTGNTNLVTSGTADASSAQDDENCQGCFADKAIDGNTNTRWSSAWSDPQWLEITLPEPQVVNGIVLKWETAHAREYCVTTLPVYALNVKGGDIVPQTFSLRGGYTSQVTGDIWILVGAPGENLWPQSPNACAGESTTKLNGLWRVLQNSTPLCSSRFE